MQRVGKGLYDRCGVLVWFCARSKRHGTEQTQLEHDTPEETWLLDVMKMCWSMVVQLIDFSSFAPLTCCLLVDLAYASID